MIPSRITEYLDRHDCSYSSLPHPRAVTAQRLAQSVHVSGFAVGKVVILDVDGIKWMAVVPASQLLDEQLVAETLSARRVRICDEDEFETLFEDCEPGAEPPFGHLFGMGVILDAALNEEDLVVFRAGTHEDALRMTTSDFRDLESPHIATVSNPPSVHFAPLGFQPSAF